MSFTDTKAKILRITKQNFKWLIAIIMLIICFNIAEELFENDIYKFDDFIYHYVSIIISPSMTVFFKFITNVGSAVAVIAICLFYFLFVKNKVYAKLMTLNLVIITVLNQVIKHVVSRPRPTGFRLIDETGYSFPSGHSMVSMAFYGFLIYLANKYVKNIYLKVTLISVLSIFIVLIGVSRIYLGVHYASDVVVGFCISISYLILFTHILNKNKIIDKDK